MLDSSHQKGQEGEREQKRERTLAGGDIIKDLDTPSTTRHLTNYLKAKKEI